MNIGFGVILGLIKLFLILLLVKGGKEEEETEY